MKIYKKWVVKNTNISNIIKQQFSYTFYQKYLFKNFALEFAIWSLAILFVLFSLSYIDNSSMKLHIAKKISYITTKSMLDFFNIFDVLVLCVCLSFFIRSKNHFNFCILNSFGVKSFEILKPILTFLFAIWFLKLFLIQPVNAMFYNKTNNHLKALNGQKVLKYGEVINIMDKIEDKLFMIKGKYDKITNDRITIKTSTILQYDTNNELSHIYYVPKLILEDNKWIIHNAFVIDNINEKKLSNYNHTFNTKTTIKSALTSLSGTIKILTNQTTIYDIITYFINIKKGQQTDNTNKQFVEKFIFNFIELFNLLICCLLTFVSCISNGRNDNFIKQIIKSFINFFILVRIFHFFINEMQNSVFFCFCVLLFDILILFLFYTMIYEKDFNRKIVNKIKKETKRFNKKIAIKTIKTIRNKRLLRKRNNTI